VHGEFEMDPFTQHSSVLVGRSHLYFMSDDWCILEYDLAGHGLAVFDAIDIDIDSDMEELERLYLVLAEDGGMRVSQELHQHLKFWKREASEGPDGRWVLSRVINLSNLLQIGDEGAARVRVVGFAEGANVIFVDTPVGLFMLELQRERVRKVSNDHGLCSSCSDEPGFRCLIPIVCFYTPVHRGEHQNLPPSSPSEEASAGEGGEEKKTLDQALQLFDKGSDAPKGGGLIC
jgi:hypothetical protein